MTHENIITSELQTHPQSTGWLAQNIYKQTRHAFRNTETCLIWHDRHISVLSQGILSTFSSLYGYNITDPDYL